MTLTAINSGLPQVLLLSIFIGLPMVRICLFLGVGTHLLSEFIQHFLQVFKVPAHPNLDLTPMEESAMEKAFCIKYVLLIIAIVSIIAVSVAAIKDLYIGIKIFRSNYDFYLGMIGYPYMYICCSLFTLFLQGSPYLLQMFSHSVDSITGLMCVTPMAAIWELIPFNLHDELLESISIYSGLMQRLTESARLALNQEEEERNVIRDEYDACLPYCRSHPPTAYYKRYMSDWV